MVKLLNKEDKEMKKTYIKPVNTVVMSYICEDLMQASNASLSVDDDDRIKNPGDFGAREVIDERITSRDIWAEEW